MPKAKKAPVSAPNVWAMTYQEGLALSQADRIIRFVSETQAGQRAFAAIGKLYRIIDKNLPKGKFINSVLGDAGIKPGTISNASYGARVFDLVESKHLEESEFDQLTFAEVAIIARVITTKSKKQLTPEQAVEIVRQGGDFQADLQAIYDSGMTAAEKTAIEDKVKADKAAAEAEAKAKAEAQAKELEEVKKRNEELAKANADMTAQAAAVQSPTPAAPVATPAAAAKPAASEPPPAPVATPTPAAPTPAAKPEADPTASCDELLALLSEVETSMAYLSDEDQGRIGARLVAMASAFVESGKAVAA
jgi:hypothetical protein